MNTRAIVRRAGRRKDADDGERIVLVSVGGAVRRLEFAADREPGFAGHGGADDGGEEIVGMEDLARRAGIGLAAAAV